MITEQTEEGILEQAENEDTSNDFNNRENAASSNTPERVNYLDAEIYKRDHLNQKIEEMTLQINQLTSNPSLQEKYLVLEKILESEQENVPTFRNSAVNDSMQLSEKRKE